MSIATEITRIAGLRDNIRAKLISVGIISDTAAITELVGDVESLLVAI